MMELSTREWLVLTYILHYISRRGYAPSYREIAKSLCLEIGANITKALDGLHDKGVIERGGHGQVRAIRVVKGGQVGVTP